VHVFVVAGRSAVGERELGPGDSVRLSGQGGRELVVTEPVTAAVWAFGV
jgi:hypothetical protein